MVLRISQLEDNACILNHHKTKWGWSHLETNFQSFKIHENSTTKVFLKQVNVQQSLLKWYWPTYSEISRHNFRYFQDKSSSLTKTTRREELTKLQRKLEHFDGGLKEPAVPMVDHIVYMHINISLKKMMHFHKLEQQLLEKKTPPTSYVVLHSRQTCSCRDSIDGRCACKTVDIMYQSHDPCAWHGLPGDK